jgi:MerR family redox-sensitive transcriptional activator SoxR
MPNKLAIGDIAQAAGLATSAVRYYERIGLLPKAERVNGRRVYDGDVLRRLTAIRVAREAGFTISEVQALVGDVD